MTVQPLVLVELTTDVANALPAPVVTDFVPLAADQKDAVLAALADNFVEESQVPATPHRK
jgi:hypothetical protein